MDSNDVQKIINGICNKHNIDSELFVGAYTNTISKKGTISCNFSTKQHYKQSKAKYGILYYKSDDIYIVWEFNAKSLYSGGKVNRCSPKILYASIEESLAEKSGYITRYALFKGHEQEKLPCLTTIEELEKFILNHT